MTETVAKHTAEQAKKLLEGAVAARAQGRYAEAELAAQQALAVVEAEGPASTADAANLLNVLASLAAALAAYRESEQRARRAWDIMEELGGRSSGKRAETIRQEALSWLGAALRSAGDYAGAEVWLKLALSRAQTGKGELLPALNNLAVLYKYTGDFERAAALYARALRCAEPASLEAATVHHNLGGLAHARGQFAEGEADAWRAWEIRCAALGPEHPETLADWCAYAALLDGLGRLEESEPIYRHSISVFERIFGPCHPQIAGNLNNLAVLRWRRGDLCEAEQLYRRAIAIKGQCLGAEHPEHALTLYNYACLLSATGRNAMARRHLDQALPVLEKRLAATHPTLLAARVLADRLRASEKRRG